MTHITKEGLLQALDEAEFPLSGWSCTKASILARAAELSAHDKPVTWEIELLPVNVDGVPEACKVRLNVGVQHFHVGADYWDTREEGVWYAAQLETAMLRAEVSIPDAVNRFLGWQLPKTFPKDGWKLVPVNCTVQMMKAFWSAGPFPEKGFMAGWHAAIAAAPEPPK